MVSSSVEESVYMFNTVKEVSGDTKLQAGSFVKSSVRNHSLYMPYVSLA